MMMYKPGDRIIITDPSVLTLYEGLLYKDCGEIIRMIPKGDLNFYYYEVKVKYRESTEWGNSITLGVPEFELDKQYYREKRLNNLLDGGT